MVDGIKNKEHLLGLTLRQLRQEASKLSVPLYSRKTKAVLIDLIVKYQKKGTEITKENLDNKITENISNPIGVDTITPFLSPTCAIPVNL